MFRAKLLPGLTVRLAVVLLFTALLSSAAPASAQSLLGSAQSFAVLGSSTVTNTGSSVVTGDLGVSPGTAITGFPPGILVGGTRHAADAVAGQAHVDATLAFTTLGALPCTRDLTGINLGGLTLTPGVYCFSSSAQLTGPLTLDAQNNPDALFVFRMGSTLTTASNSSVVMINGGNHCNVYWHATSSVTLGTGTTFVGHILALISVTMTTAANLSGSAFALTGAVTLDTNNIEVAVCGSTCGVFPPHRPIKVTGAGEIRVPTPNTAAPDATGRGTASFNFSATLSKSGYGTGVAVKGRPLAKSGDTAATGSFDYVNHVTGLHVYGPVTNAEVVAIDSNGSPKTVRFSGTCLSLPACSFAVTLEDRGRHLPAIGIAITGAVHEVKSQRPISQGSIEFYAR
jgi:hypothetical protein